MATVNYRYEGELPGTMSIDKDGKISATRRFKYFIEAYNANELPSLLRDTSLPKPYSSFPNDSALKCVNVSLGEVTGGDNKSGLIVATCSYSNNVTSGGGSIPAANANPWDLPVQGYSYEPLDEVRPMLKGYETVAGVQTKTKDVVNSAGDILLLNEWTGVMVFKFYYFIKDFTETWEADYHNSINDANISIAGKPIAKRRGRLRKFTSKPVYLYSASGSVAKTYYQVDVEILHSPERDWVIEALDAGTRLNIGNTYREICTDLKGNYGYIGDGTMTEDMLDKGKISMVTTECRLNGLGTGVLKPEDKSEYIKFEYREKDWSKLKIPQELKS